MSNEVKVMRLCILNSFQTLKKKSTVLNNNYFCVVVLDFNLTKHLHCSLNRNTDYYVILQIRRFSPRVLAPGEEVTLFELAPNISSLPQNFHLESYIQIITNVSIVTAPLLCYDGHVIKVS